MRLASRGLRDLDQGSESIGQAEIRAAVQRQARRVMVKALVTTVALTGIVLVIPGP